MTRRLILIRHAKSSWDDPFEDDHARVLNNRGRASAGAIGLWLAKKGYLPDVILSSDATRTRETAQLVLARLPGTPQLTLSRALYHASPDTVVDLIHKQTAATVAVIGHNPGLGILAQGLLPVAPDHPRFADYPTCATTVVDFAGDDWTGVKPQSGAFVDFTVPRDLIGVSHTDIDLA